VKKYLRITACALGGFAASAQAADLGSMKDEGTEARQVITNIFDGAAPGTITVAGITVYGAVDVNLVYQTHGAPSNGYWYQGAQYLVAKNSGKERFDFSNNAIQQSFVGVKINQSLYDLLGHDGFAGWAVSGNVQTNFDPAFADIADACRSQRMNNGTGNVPPATWNGDGSRCGQFFNADAWIGLKHNVLGEVRYGRQLTLLGEDIAAYDPQAGSYAYSLFAYSGTFGGGFGATEEARWNNSFSYRNAVPVLGTNVRIAGQYRLGSFGQGNEDYDVSAGIDLSGPLKGLSIDGVWGQQKSAILAGQLSAAQCGTLTSTLFECQQLDELAGTITDTEAWAIMAKYNFAHFGHPELTVMGGYEHIDLANPRSPIPAGYSIIGNYILFSTNNAPFTTDRQNDVYWLGGKWAITPKLTAAGAWYNVDQNTFVAHSTTANTFCTKPGQGTASQANCAGSVDWASFSLDYQWTKRLDVYAGVSYTQARDGLASGFTNTNTWNPTVGARFRF
jgi:predicted porin